MEMFCNICCISWRFWHFFVCVGGGQAGVFHIGALGGSCIDRLLSGWFGRLSYAALGGGSWAFKFIGGGTALDASRMLRAV